MIIISGYSHLKEAFVKNGEIFSDRPKAHDIFTETATGNGKNVIQIVDHRFKLNYVCRRLDIPYRLF